MSGVMTFACGAPRVDKAHAIELGPLAQPRAPVLATPLAVRFWEHRSASADEAFGSRCLLGSLSTAMAARAVRRRSRPHWRVPRNDSASLVKSPPETYEALVEKGLGKTKMSVLKILYNSVMGGCYVGMAGLLSLGISGNMGSLSYNMAAQKFVFAALFPVNLLLVLQSGAQLFTGNTAEMSFCLFEGKITLQKLAKVWVTSWIGNVIGGTIIAYVAMYTNLLSGGTADLAMATVLKKCGSSFGVTFVKAVMCNWLVCMAVFLSTQAQDMTGKMVGIWFPISMFVAIGFEHSVANMFLLPAGLFSGSQFTVIDVLVKNLIPVTLGNAFAGVVIIGLGFSFAFGAMGKGNRGSFSGWIKKVLGRSKEVSDERE